MKNIYYWYFKTLDNSEVANIIANELAEMLGVSVGHAYKLIRKLNQELEKEGFLVIAGKVPRRYFEKRWYGFSA